MNAERREEVWSRYLSREPITPSEEADLVEMLGRDEESRIRCVEEARLDGWLSGLLAAPRDEDAFAHRFEGLLAAERDESRFVRKVRDLMAGETAPKGRRKPTRRRILRRPRSAGTPALVSILIPALAAAGFVLILLLVPGSPPRMERPVARKTNPPPAPPAPEIVRPVETPERSPSPAVPSAAPADRPDAPKTPRFPRRKPSQSPVTPVPPPRRPPPPPTTVVAKASIATLEQVEGRVALSAAGTSNNVGNGAPIASGASLHVTGGPAAVRYPDGTVLRIEAGTSIEALADTPQGPAGKTLRLVQGSLAAVVTRQPAGRPFVVHMPNAVATVLGTTLTLTAKADRSRLEVLEGRVRFRRQVDGRTLDVAAGFQAVVAEGVPFRRQPIEAAIFEDTFSRLPLDAWPATWRRHRNSTALRSGFQVVADRAGRGNRILACPSAPGGATQHAVLPLDAYPESVEFIFRLRLSGPRNTRAGVELEDGNVMPSVEVDAQAGVLRIDWPRGTPLAEKQFRLGPNAWSLWNVRADADGIRIDINGRTELRAKLPGFTRVTGASLISRGADTAEYDDVKVVRRLHRRR